MDSQLKSDPRLLSAKDAIYHEQRILQFIDSIQPDSYPDTLITEPESSALISITEMSSSAFPTKPKNLSYADGRIYLQELKLRRVELFGGQIPSQEESETFMQMSKCSNVVDPLNELSFNHAVKVRESSTNEATYLLVLPFLMTEWLIMIPRIKFSVNAQWKTDPLESISLASKPLCMPKPDLTVGLSVPSSWTHKLADLLSYTSPVLCHPDIMFPFLTVEAKKNDNDQGKTQNFHNAAAMLRNLRAFSQQSPRPLEFDQKIRVFTITLGINCVQVYGHWTICCDKTVTYHHSMLKTWWLTDQKEDWCAARYGLERYTQWILEETASWIDAVLPSIKDTIHA